jgi:osmoprotectant transport system ATP-binding protein
MIDAECLSKVFGDVPAVADVSFHVDAGQTLALVGTSGCGKTTTLRLLNRLLEPSSGRVRIGGEDVGAYEPAVLRRQIGYVFQGLGLFPHLTVAENIGITPSLLGWERAKIEQRVEELLRVVGLADSDLGQRRPDELSGGQRQRVAVARALAARPRVMLLDEPFGALDPVTRDGLQQTFRQLQREVGFTAVFVTHDVVEACVVADRIAVMEAGRIVQVGTAAELAAAPAPSLAAALFAMPTRHARSFLRATGGQL